MAKKLIRLVTLKENKSTPRSFTLIYNTPIPPPPLQKQATLLMSRRHFMTYFNFDCIAEFLIFSDTTFQSISYFLVLESV